MTSYVDAIWRETRVKMPLISHLQSSVTRDRNGIIQKFFLISFSERIIYQTKHKNRYSKIMTLAL